MVANIVTDGSERHTSRSKMLTKLEQISKTRLLSNRFVHRDVVNMTNLPIVFIESLLQTREEKHVHSCITNISLENGHIISPYMNIHNRLVWSNDQPTSHPVASHSTHAQTVKFYRGPYSFGICEKHPSYCGHFLFIEDPYDHVTSSYMKCRSTGSSNHDICAAIDAKKVSFQTWVRHHRNTLLNQLLWTPDLCSSEILRGVNISNIEQHILDKTNIPCWFKHKLYIEQNHDVSDIEYATSYIADHMSEWFSFIGLSKDIDSSLDMMNVAFNLSFSKCKLNEFRNDILTNQLKNNNVNKYDVIHNKGKLGVPNSVSTVNDNKNTVSNIQIFNRTEIDDLLKHDHTIYREAKRLFYIQQQIHTNKISTHTVP